MCAFHPAPRPELSLAKCDGEIVREFESIAKDLEVPLQKLEPGYWEMRTAVFTLRIRAGLGEWSDERAERSGLLVTLLRSSAPVRSSRLGFDYEHEIGLGVIATHFRDWDIYQPGQPEDVMT
ncbi:hypothetical protein ASA1KI_31420 [Opitutales bacterium ASA1]|uniref:hypothetical protein n=1 Tax=Congregicoccus parvus TaxID=3081749 RepID=UPI002B2D1F4C|nr:hypothetical protein ASA1KI_31420 [Opitutales bacterium ASA1]